jgi:NitT/TauT family transport system substrate-binding protein
LRARRCASSVDARTRGARPAETLIQAAADWNGYNDEILAAARWCGRSQTARHSVADADCPGLRGAVRLRGEKRFAGLHLVLTVAFAVGAGSVAAAQTAKTPTLKNWRHGIIEAKSDAGILFAASRRDFAATLGLKLDFVQLKNDAIALKALLAGDLDRYEGGTGEAIIAASHGGDVKIVGCNWLVPPHGVYVRDNIASMVDLKGKSVAVSAPGSFPEIFARAAFEKAGIPVSAVKFAAMGADSDRYRALMAGVVDAAIITNEFVPLAGKQAIRDIMPAREVVSDFLRVCVQMTGKTLAQRRDDAVRSIASEIEGMRFAMSHRDATIQLTRDITGMKADDPRPAYVFDEAVKTKSVATEMPIPMDRLDVMQKQLVSAGSLARPIDLEKAVDKSAREQALALLAK